MTSPLPPTALTQAAARAFSERGASEESFKRMVESIKDYAIFMLDKDGHIASWNEGARRFKGYEASEIIGKHFSIFYEEAARRAGRPQMLLAQAVKDNRVEDEGWRVRKDGTRFWADVVITALRDERGELIGFAKVTRDLSARREAEEALRQSEERFRLMVDAVKDYAIFMLDTEGRVTTWNSGAERIKGYKAKEILGRSIETFYTPEDVASGKLKRELELAAREGRFEDEGLRVRKDGSRFWANVVISAVHDETGKLVGFTKVTRDLSDRQRQEQDRIRAVQAEEAIRLRDEFLSIASHELKTPLTALQLQLQSLQETLHTQLESDERTRRKLARANDSTSRLTDLIEMLLDVSRLTTGRFELHPERLDLGDVTQEAVERLAETARRANAPVTFHASAVVEGTWDRVRIEQVVTNLVSNAIKYGGGAAIDVRVEGTAAQAKIVVSDAGPGIPAQDLMRIFGRFERAVSMRHYGGMGLGLYISKQIVEAHGGEIAAENLPERGARFTVVLPRKPDFAALGAQVATR